MFHVFEDSLSEFTRFCAAHRRDGEGVKGMLGLFKLQCFELVMLYVKLIKDEEDTFELLKMRALCRCLLNLALAHPRNNLFLAKFRALMSVLKVHCVAQLRFMTLECAMLRRFQAFYVDASRRGECRWW